MYPFAAPVMSSGTTPPPDLPTSSAASVKVRTDLSASARANAIGFPDSAVIVRAISSLRFPIPAAIPWRISRRSWAESLRAEAAAFSAASMASSIRPSSATQTREIVLPVKGLTSGIVSRAVRQEPLIKSLRVFMEPPRSS